MFTVSFNFIIELPEPPRNNYRFKIWKRFIEEADKGAFREISSKLTSEAITNNINEATDFSIIEKVSSLSYWYKLESFASHVRDISKRVYIPSSYIIIDEAMMAFRGRIIYITKFKNKSIKEKYKN
jgi:hypothetical protein